MFCLNSLSLGLDQTSICLERFQLQGLLFFCGQMHDYYLVARNVRPPHRCRLLWGRMQFGAFRMANAMCLGAKKGKRRVRSECWMRCRLCKDKIKPLEIYPACLCLLCTYLSESASFGDNFTLTPTLPIWESNPLNLCDGKTSSCICCNLCNLFELLVCPSTRLVL